MLWVKLVLYVFTWVFTAGVFVNFGLGWALMTAGLFGVIFMLVVVDTEGKDGKT